MDEVYTDLSHRLGFIKTSPIQKIEKQFEGCKRKFDAANAKKAAEQEIKRRQKEQKALTKRASYAFMEKAKKRKAEEKKRQR